MMRTPHVHRGLVCLAILSMVVPAPGSIVESTWVGGGGDSNWTNAGNWAPAMVPDNDTNNSFNVTIDNAGVDLGSDVTIVDFTFNTTGGVGSTLTITAGSELRVDGDATIDFGGVTGGEMHVVGATAIGRELSLDGCMFRASGDIDFGTAGANGLIELAGGAQLLSDGNLTILRDGTIDAGGGTLVNGGNLVKSGTNGTASITGSALVDSGGTIAVQTGTLDLDGIEMLDSTLVAEDGTTLRIGQIGVLSEAGGSANVCDTTGTGIIEFSGGVFEVNGVVASTGTGVLQFVNGVRLIGQGGLNASATAPALMNNCAIGDPNSGTGVENLGSMDLIAVTISDRGLRNKPGGEIRIPGGLVGGIQVEFGTFVNEGTVEQEKQINLGAVGVVTNAMTWNSHGGNIIGSTSGRFDNSGTFSVDGDSPVFTLVTAPFRGLAGSTIDINNGEMRVGGSDPNTTRFTDCFIDVAGANNLFSYGVNGSSRSTSQNVTFVLADDGRARFYSGVHDARGSLVCDGQGQVTIENAQLRATAPLTLRFSNTAPLVLNNTNARIDASGEITNEDRVNSVSGSITGSAAFRNALNGVLDVTDNLRISQGTSGRIRNEGILRLSGSNFEGILIDTGGSIENESDGVIDFAANADISRLSATQAGDLINAGLVTKTGDTGESLISTAVYRQTGDGMMRSSSGTIRVIADLIELLGGRLEALAASAVVRIGESSLTQDIRCQFLGGGIVDYAGATSDLHELVGTISGTGDGAMLHSNGTMRARDLSATLDFGADPNEPGAGTAEFRQISGTLGEAGSQLNNRGNFRMTGGTLVGNFDNIESAAFRLEGGVVQGVFANSGDFVWDGGTIDAQVSTSPVGQARFEIVADTPVLLASGARMTNTGRIEHSGAGSLELGQNAEVVNQGGSAAHVFSGGGDIVRPGGAVTGSKVINSGRIANEGPANVSINVLFESTGGSIEAEAGPLTINGIVGQAGGQPKITGGTLVSTGPAAGLTTQSAELRGAITHTLGAEGVVSHQLPDIDATLTATGNGRVEITSLSALGGSLQFVGAGESTFALRGDNFVGVAAASSGGTVRFESSACNLFGGGNSGSWSADNEVIFASDTGSASVNGVTGGSRAVFASSGQARQTGGLDLKFDGAVQFDNTGTYDLQVDSGLSARDASGNDILFENTGTFRKSNGLSTGFSTVSIPFRNTGTVAAEDGNLRITPFCQSLSGTHLSEGTWQVDPNSSLSLNNGVTLTRNSGTIRVRGNGDFKNLPTATTTTTFQNDGTLCLEDGAVLLTGGEFENNGTTKVSQNSTLSVGTIDNDNDLTVDGTLTFAGASRWQSGTISGTGVVNGSSLTSSARTSPGNSPGKLTIQADFTHEPNAVLAIELAGLLPENEYDVLEVQGTFAVDGTLEVSLLNDFSPGSADAFTIVSAAQVTGAFGNAPPDPNGIATLQVADGSFRVAYSSTSIVLRDFQPLCPGDTNGDLVVNLTDLADVLNAFGTMAGDAGYLPAADFDGDGDVDLSDLSTVLGRFGATC